MARRARSENETTEQTHERRLFESVANAADRSEKTSWSRKEDNMVKLLATLAPIEEAIKDLASQKMPIFDNVQKLREAMVAECIHPYQYLIQLDQDLVECKFCNRKVKVPAMSTTNGD